MTSLRIQPVLLLSVLFAWSLMIAHVGAVTTLEQICRIKGQEENRLTGIGLVTGLAGTGDADSFGPTTRGLATALTLLGDQPGVEGLEGLKNAKNVALVQISVTVPKTGGRQGDVLDCVVTSMGSAKSLEGGRLFLSMLVGPNPRDQTIYAIADGPIQVDNAAIPTSGRVHRGCQLEADISTPISQDGLLTLVLEGRHASLQMAQAVAETINHRSLLGFESGGDELAKAVDAVNVVVSIPPPYADKTVQLASLLLQLELRDMPRGPRVLVDSGTGQILIGEDVEFRPLVVSHRNIVIDAGMGTIERFVPMDPSDPENPKLGALVKMLNAVNLPTDDVIEIIKQIDGMGYLNAELIVP